jgi:hypothetical protein
VASALRYALERKESPARYRTRLEAIRTGLFRERTSFDNHWKECSDFVRPRRSRFTVTDKNRGDRRNQNIIDSTATFASGTLASGLHSGMSSPARPWFKATIADPDLAKFKPVQAYLEDVTQRMQQLYARANLYQSLPTLYQDLGDFGTGAMAVLADAKDLFRTRVFPIGSYALGLDARGLATTFVRDYTLSVLELVEEFGLRPGSSDIDWSHISKAVQRAWDKGEYDQQIQISWVIHPNPYYEEGSPLSTRMKWSSCHFETGAPTQGDPDFLRESGFQTFPIMAPRWATTDGDSYGTDWPCAVALGDIKQLQLMHREKAKGIQKMVSPPMVGAAELRTQKTTTLPSDVTYTRDPQHGFRAAYQVALDIADLRLDIQDVRYLISRAYYEDLFLMLARSDALESDPAKTATEIAERKEEKMLALGPMLERSNDELFDLQFDRIFEMAEAAGEMPEPPEELVGMRLSPENTSILAQAQKLVGVNQLDRLLTTASSMAAVWPETRHKIDSMRAIDDYGEMYGTDPLVVRTNDEAQKLADAEAQQQADAARAEAIQKTGAGVKSAADAKLGTGSALDALVGTL